jgi:hypothetical protein
LISATLFVLCGGTMNLAFATSLGTDEITKYCWAALSVGATLYTLAGLDLAHRAFRQRERARGVAATAVLLFALGYDVLSAYSFSARQHESTSHIAAEATRKYETAKAELFRAEADLAEYADAQPLEVAKQHERSMQQQVETLPSATKCARPPDKLRLTCEHRAVLAEGLRKAEATRVRADAKVRLAAAVEAARTALNNAPAPQAPDPRAQLLGEAGAEWLPVLLLTFGSLLGFFASQVPGEATAEPRAKRRVANLIHRLTAESNHDQIMKAPTTITPAPRAQSVQAHVKLVEGLTALEAADRLPVGLTRDEEGYIRGTQRALAAATGLRHAPAFTRAVKRASDDGMVELASSGPGTGVRIAQPITGLRLV